MDRQEILKRYEEAQMYEVLIAEWLEIEKDIDTDIIYNVADGFESLLDEICSITEEERNKIFEEAYRKAMNIISILRIEKASRRKPLAFNCYRGYRFLVLR